MPSPSSQHRKAFSCAALHISHRCKALNLLIHGVSCKNWQSPESASNIPFPHFWGTNFCLLLWRVNTLTQDSVMSATARVLHLPVLCSRTGMRLNTSNDTFGTGGCFFGTSSASKRQGGNLLTSGNPWSRSSATQDCMWNLLSKPRNEGCI